MRRTTAITVACMTAAALTVTACGRSSDTGGSGAAQTGAAVNTGPAKGNLTMWAMGAEGDKLPELLKDFEAANPGVKVQVTAIPWDAAHDKFMTAVTANKTPDLAMVGTTWMGELAGSKALDPVPSQIDKSVFFEGAQKSTEVSGTSYGIPWYVETRVVFYRSDLAKKAGFDTVPTDQAGLKEMAKAMQTKAGAKWGIGLQAGGTGSWQTLMPFAWSNGADLTKDGGKAYNFDSPPMLEATKYYQSFFTDGISDKAAPATPTTEPDFASGKVPMFIFGRREGGRLRVQGQVQRRPDPGRVGWVVLVRRRLQPRRLQEHDEPRRRVEARAVARQARRAGEVVHHVDRPALGQERVAGSQAGVGQEARGLRQAARDGQVAAVVHDMGAGRRQPRHRAREGDEDRL
jgi:ABC-type glycerol-3-phosphate transport system substrate-binding protein